MKTGIYETNYGNAAYVPNDKTQHAFDLDMGEWCPISEVTTKRLRNAEPDDRIMASRVRKPKRQKLVRYGSEGQRVEYDDEADASEHMLRMQEGVI